jgi:RNA polymerase sigma factor (sigma-70 family)
LDIVQYCESHGESRYACARAGCATCQRALLRENEGLVWKVIKAQRIGLAEYADMMQEGRIGCWMAVQYYEPSRGYRFSTLAWRLMCYRIWKAVLWASKDEGYLPAPPEKWPEEQIVEEWQASELRQALEAGLAKLSAQQQEVVKRHAGWNDTPPQTYGEIGKPWGLSRQRVHQIHEQALMLLRTPGLSIHLRSLYERDSREEYREALQKNWKRQRRWRGRK